MPRLNRSRLLTGAAVLGLAIQLVPYRVHNPEVRQEPQWDRAETRELARRACFDCHSNEVVTPWYGYVAPVAWVVRRHVDEARGELNFSEWDRPQEEAHEAAEEVDEGHMPPGYYLPFHAEARLSDAERTLLVDGLEATLGGEDDDQDDDHEDHH